MKTGKPKPLLSRRSQQNIFARSSNFIKVAEDQRLNEAFAVLKINRGEFEKLHTKELKQKFLIHKLCYFEFKTYTDDPKNRKDMRVCRKMLKEAFDVISKSDLLNKHVDQYGRHSYGLVELDITRELSGSNVGAGVKLSRSSLEMCLPKSDGVEPGYLGYQLEDVFLSFFKKFPDQKTRLEKIALMKGRIDFFLEGYKLGLPRHVIKLTYENISKSGEVIPNKKDLARTSTMKAIKKRLGAFGHAIVLQLYQRHKTCKVEALNCDAVSEVLANDVARAFGMEVQNQCLVKNNHRNGRTQFALKAEWIEGASLLQPLAGSSKNQNYFVEPVAKERLKVKALSSGSIKKLSEHFSLFACLGDRDKVGSRGQNLLRKGGKLIGIDFGHAYASKNPLVDTLKSDFTFHAPSFKNHSLFLDGPRSELMKGVLKLARWKGVRLDNSVVESYGSEFSASYKAIEERADERIFDDYIKKFETMKLEDPKNTREYDVIIKEVKKKKAAHIRSRNKIIKTFEHYLHLPAELVDTMENIEKLCASAKGNASMRSPDGTVILKHLRVIKNPVLRWSVGCCDSKSVSVSAEFSSASDARRALLCFPKHELRDTLNLTRDRKKVTFTFPRNQLTNVSALLSEDGIKGKYHPKDFQLANLLMSENKFSTLEAYGLSFETTVKRGGDFALSVRVKDGVKLESIDGISDESRAITNLLVRGLSACQCSVKMRILDGFDIEVPCDKLDRVSHFLTVFHTYHKHYQEAHRQLAELSEKMQQEDLGVNFMLELVYHEGEFKFHFKVRSTGNVDNTNVDLYTNGNMIQTIAQLESIKSTVLEVYEQHRAKQYKQQLSDQVQSLSSLLEAQVSSAGVSPSIFTSVDQPIASLRQSLVRWAEHEQRYAPRPLVDLEKAVRSGLKHVDTENVGSLGNSILQLIKQLQENTRICSLKRPQSMKLPRRGSYLKQSASAEAPRRASIC